MPQNFEVRVTNFGTFHRGDVIPGYETGGHDVDQLVKLGVLAPTDKPVNVELAPRKVKAGAPPEDVYLERDRLFAEAAKLRADAKSLEGERDAAVSQRDDLRKQIAKYVEDNGHLTRACEEHQAARESLEKEIAEHKAELAGARLKAAELTAELEAATAPAAK